MINTNDLDKKAILLGKLMGVLADADGISVNPEWFRHPVDHIAAVMRLPIDDLALISSLRGAPLPVVKCVTNDVRVPADAEWVLEGFIDPHGHVEAEGPARMTSLPQGSVGLALQEIPAVTHQAIEVNRPLGPLASAIDVGDVSRGRDGQPGRQLADVRRGVRSEAEPQRRAPREEGTCVIGAADEPYRERGKERRPADGDPRVPASVSPAGLPDERCEE